MTATTTATTTAAAAATMSTTMTNNRNAPPPQTTTSSSGGGSDDALKIFVSRVPAAFDAAAVQRLLEAALGTGTGTGTGSGNTAVVHVALAATTTTTTMPSSSSSSASAAEKGANVSTSADRGGGNDDDDRFHRPNKTKKKSQQSTSVANAAASAAAVVQQQQQQHRGFAFVTLKSVELVQRAVHEIKTVKGSASGSSTSGNGSGKKQRQHTLYIGPCLTDEQKETAAAANTNHNNTSTAASGTAACFGGGGAAQVCFLWTAHRCPYGNDGACKFAHTGPGGCCLNATRTATSAASSSAAAKSKIKCRDHRKNKCKLGSDACPFSHNFVPSAAVVAVEVVDEKQRVVDGKHNKRSDAEKDCIDWKTKGKCRKRAKNLPCPYKHDPAKCKKRKQPEVQAPSDSIDAAAAAATSGKTGKKVKQPLTVRVFGLNYETTEDSVRKLFVDAMSAAAATAATTTADDAADHRIKQQQQQQQQQQHPIVAIDFPTFGDSGRSKGYCAITFQSPQAVDVAVQALHGAELEGRWLSVQAGKMMLDDWEQHHHHHRVNHHHRSTATTATATAAASSSSAATVGSDNGNGGDDDCHGHQKEYPKRKKSRASLV